MSTWRPSLVDLALAGLAFACALAGAAGPGFAQQPPPMPRDEVVITGKSDDEAIRAFVGEVTQDRSPENQLSRWDRAICTGIAGLQQRHAQMVLDRIGQRAMAVGLEVGKPGCGPNIVIVVTSDPDATARELADKFPRKVGRSQEANETTLGRESLQAFRQSAAPVRWWFVSNTVSDDGRKIADPLNGSAPTLRVSGASLIHRQTRQDLARAFLIVDSRQINGVEFLALADYLSMVSLAQIDPGADTSGFSTILSLFATRRTGEAPVSAMTPWDLAYLESLYKTTRNASSAAKQERDIARRMNSNPAQ